MFSYKGKPLFFDVGAWLPLPQPWQAEKKTHITHTFKDAADKHINNCRI